MLCNLYGRHSRIISAKNLDSLQLNVLNVSCIYLQLTRLTISFKLRVTLAKQKNVIVLTQHFCLTKDLNDQRTSVFDTVLF